MEFTEDPYYFIVEGDCEESYLLHLQSIINANRSKDKGKIKFIIDRSKNLKFSRLLKSKGMAQSTTIYYFFDHENDKERFEKIIDAIIKARKEAKPKCKHILCYTNLSFELLMILHKNDMNKHLCKVPDYIRFINKAFKTDYESINEFKENTNFNNCLNQIGLPEIKQAIRRASYIMKNKENVEELCDYSGFKYYKNNPSLSSGEAIKDILEKCGIEIE